MEHAKRQKIACAIIALTLVGIAPQASMAASFDVVTDFNNTGVQPAPGNPHTFPFTYGTETALNTGFTLLPFFGNTNCSVAANSCQNAGTVDNYYFIQPDQFSGPAISKVASGGTLIFPSIIPLVVPNNVLVMMPGDAILTAPTLVPRDRDVEAINDQQFRELGQLGGQELAVPAGVLGDLVVGEGKRAALGFG
jgi:hypothetical protein